jgi:hypothetical protein
VTAGAGDWDRLWPLSDSDLGPLVGLGDRDGLVGRFRRNALGETGRGCFATLRPPGEGGSVCTSWEGMKKTFRETSRQLSKLKTSVCIFMLYDVRIYIYNIYIYICVCVHT